MWRPTWTASGAATTRRFWPLSPTTWSGRSTGSAGSRARRPFDGEIENDAFEGHPELTVRTYLEDGDVVVMPHTGVGRFKGGGEFGFQACDLFTFRGELISRVESYVVPEAGFDGIAAQPG